MLGSLRPLVLDEVRLVDNHAAEAEFADPVDVAVETP